MQSYAEPKVTAGLKSKDTKYRIVVDTNILVSAFLYGGRPAAVFEEILSSHTLILSDYIVDELVACLRIVRPKAPQKWVRALRQQLSKYCYDYDEVGISSRDFKDNPILHLAHSESAFILTGDKDILSLEISKGVASLTIDEFEALFL